MAMKVGVEQTEAPEINLFERLYIRIFGYPALGLRIRTKSILPIIASLPEPEMILDAGCGKGVFTFAVGRVFPRAKILGVDTSCELVKRNTELAKRLATTNISFDTLDLTRLEAKQAFDVILATDVLEHVENDRDLLVRFRAALKVSGRLVLHVPHITRHVLWWSRENFTEIEGHVRPGYTLEGLKEMLMQAGFEIENAFYNYNSVETLMNDISYLITRGHERRKQLYAFCFPLLLVGSWLATGIRPRKGSGVVVLARRSAKDAVKS
jgi:SAM-dependent methyltransferase